MAYIVQSDLENRLGANTVRALYDDSGAGTVNTTALGAVMQAASDRVDSYIATVYRSTLPFSTVPDMVKEATIEWAIALSFRRKPEYLQTYWSKALPDLFKSAEDFCKRIIEAKQYLPDNTSEPYPVSNGAQVRTGDADDPTVDAPARVFQDMGDF